jgi:hypothetical protein
VRPGSPCYISWVLIDMYLEIANGDEEFLMIWKSRPRFAFDGKSWLNANKLCVSYLKSGGRACKPDSVRRADVNVGALRRSFL